MENENLIKALHDAQFLEKDLRAVYHDAIGKNDALVVLTSQLIEQATKITIILSQLQDLK